jgi:hypothetical protein
LDYPNKANINMPSKHKTFCARANYLIRQKNPRHEFIYASYMLFVILCIASGCVRLGPPLETIPLPQGVPSLSTILSGLAENEDALFSFRASGTIMVQIPEVESTQISRESTLVYQSPNKLNIVGRRFGTRGIELTYVDDGFLLEFPTQREYCYKDRETNFETLSSSDIVQEMFRPESWRDLTDREVRIIAYDSETQTAELEIWTHGRHPWRKRLLIVQGAPWVLLENNMFNNEGVLIAKTTKREYHEQEGIRYPTEIECSYPDEEAWMRFIMRRVDVNPELDITVFDLARRVESLNKRDFSRVDIFAGEGPSIEELNQSDQQEPLLEK